VSRSLWFVQSCPSIAHFVISFSRISIGMALAVVAATGFAAPAKADFFYGIADNNTFYEANTITKSERLGAPNRPMPFISTTAIGISPTEPTPSTGFR
jgi:hypothetical protein